MGRPNPLLGHFPRLDGRGVDVPDAEARRRPAGGGQIFNIGKSKAQVFENGEGTNVTFKDVAGVDGAKEELHEIVDFLKKPGKYTELGAKIPKALCSWALRARARRCWRRPWRARPRCLSSA